MSPSLREYQQQALATADPAGRELSYLIPGIVGEVGEMFGHRAKALWHEKSPEALQSELRLEMGDVAWMVAVLLFTQRITHVDTLLFRPQPSWWNLHLRPDPWSALLRHASTLYQWSLDPQTHQYIGSAASQLWADMDTFAQEITGVPLEDVLRANIEKLRSRASRGVLQGSGDHR